MKRAPVFFAFLLAAAPARAAGPEQYRGISVPPYEFYEALTSYARQRDCKAIGRSLKYLAPLLDEIAARTGENIGARLESAAKRGDVAGTEAAVYRLLFLDLRLNLTAARKAILKNARDENLLMAQVDYRFLSPAMRAKDRGANGRVAAAMRAAYLGDDGFADRKVEEALSVLAAVFGKEPADGVP